VSEAGAPGEKNVKADTENQRQTHAFQAETRQVLRLMIQSLYSNKEVFLRELISNASDACDRLRFEAIQDESLYGSDSNLRIEIEFDPEEHLLIVRDNGIGMDHEEVMENIGTIARSGTRAFLEQLTGDAEQDANLIGQFGVGFYSAFIVADEVELLTRKAGRAAAEGVRWVSDGSGEFTIEHREVEHRGTEVRLKLKASETSFLNRWTLESLVSRYSDHIGIPIRMQSESEDAGEGGEAEASSAWKTVNEASALWTLPKSEIDNEAYQGFYRHISQDMGNSLGWAHNHVEGAQSYTTLLYVPEKAPFQLVLERDERKGLKLYVRRVFIMDAAQQLLPHYLRFIRGVVDSNDLPLNVSRELLQENELLGRIRSAVIRRSLDLIGSLAEEEDKYATFWRQFGAILKEGIVEDLANRERIAGLLRFASTHSDSPEQGTSLADYVARMKADQKAIYFITAESHRAAAGSPQLEVFLRNGIEVLLMSDRVDEWMMGYFTEFDGKPFQSVSKGVLDLPGEDHEVAEDAAKSDNLRRVEKVLGERVSEVRLSRRLTESPSCLVLEEDQMALHMRRLLEQAGQEIPDARPALELNPDHPLVKNLLGSEDDEAVGDLAILLFEQAVLAEGGQLEDPAGFVRRMNAMLLAGVELQDREELPS